MTSYNIWLVKYRDIAVRMRSELDSADLRPRKVGATRLPTMRIPYYRALPTYRAVPTYRALPTTVRSLLPCGLPTYRALPTTVRSLLIVRSLLTVLYARYPDDL